MIQSQENCLYSSHRLTCERWEGDWHEGFCSYVYFVRRVTNAPDFYVMPNQAFPFGHTGMLFLVSGAKDALGFPEPGQCAVGGGEETRE